METRGTPALSETERDEIARIDKAARELRKTFSRPNGMLDLAEVLATARFPVYVLHDQSPGYPLWGLDVETAAGEDRAPHIASVTMRFVFPEHASPSRIVIVSSIGHGSHPACPPAVLDELTVLPVFKKLMRPLLPSMYRAGFAQDDPLIREREAVRLWNTGLSDALMNLPEPDRLLQFRVVQREQPVPFVLACWDTETTRIVAGGVGVPASEVPTILAALSPLDPGDDQIDALDEERRTAMEIAKRTGDS